MPATRTLNDIMQFDHVIQVHEDGSITEPPDIWAPELHADLDADGQETGDYTLEGMFHADGTRDRWELLNGYSGQWNYPGPFMHSSEFIGGRMEDDIRSEPGVYVALVVYYLAPNGYPDTEPESWAVARKVD